MADSKVGPHDPCRACGASNWKKEILLPHAVMREGHESKFPIRVELPSVNRRGEDGRMLPFDPAQDRRHVVFKNQAEQREWLTRHGKILTSDTVDPTYVGKPYNHEVLDFLVPPSKEAADILASITPVKVDLPEGVDYDERGRKVYHEYETRRAAAERAALQEREMR